MIPVSPLFAVEDHDGTFRVTHAPADFVIIGLPLDVTRALTEIAGDALDLADALTYWPLPAAHVHEASHDGERWAYGARRNTSWSGQPDEDRVERFPLCRSCWEGDGVVAVATEPDWTDKPVRCERCHDRACEQQARA